MRLLGIDINLRQAAERRSDSILNDKYWGGSSNASASGAYVSPETAVRNSAVYACVRLLSTTIATLPLPLYERLENGGKKRAVDNPFYWLFQSKPNEWMTQVELMEFLLWCLLLRGNAYALIGSRTNDTGSQVPSLIPISPDAITATVKEYKAVYTYRDPKTQKQSIIPNSNIVHLRGPTRDGINGLGPLQLARDPIGLALTLDDYNSKLYQNGVRLSGILKHPETLDDEVHERIANSFRTAYAGSSNSGKVAIIEEGMEFQPVSMTNKDAEFLESRKFQIAEVARLFGVPPHLIGDLERSTNNNIEHQGIDFVRHCVRPWLVRIEKSLSITLFSETDQKKYFYEFLVDGLLRGDFKSRMEGYNLGINMGVLTPNEVREMENRNPLEWGEYTLVPLNMKPIAGKDDLDDVGETEEEPALDEEDDDEELNSERAAVLTLARTFQPTLNRYFTKELNYFTSGEFSEYRVEEFFKKDFREHLLRDLTPSLDMFLELFGGKKFRDFDSTELLSPWVDSFLTARRQLLELYGPKVASELKRSSSKDTREAATNLMMYFHKTFRQQEASNASSN